MQIQNAKRCADAHIAYHTKCLQRMTTSSETLRKWLPQRSTVLATITGHMGCACPFSWLEQVVLFAMSGNIARSNRDYGATAPRLYLR